MITYSHNLPRNWQEEMAVPEDKELKWLLIFCDQMPENVDLRIRLAAPKSRAEVSVIYLGCNGEGTAMNIRLVHEAPETYSRVTAKAALFDQSRFEFRGMLKVEREAKGSDTYLLAKGLMVSPEARAEIYPYLEIATNEIRASHGSTVGYLDKNQLFYLQSRGLSRGEAERIILAGFFRDVAKEMPAEYAAKFFQLT
ncbi:MAG: SufD family Fe-S cluster assembly protein [Parcubacteria group bacterium]|nr:SufD family Fe-S cluster assembly protein [Parcubacteria group bacterium]